jgi:hypothetical protein
MKAVAKKSGYDRYDGIWGNPYYDEELNGIGTADFIQKRFSPGPALVRRNDKGLAFEWIEFTGQDYDESQYVKVDGFWDHQHCNVCQYSIATEDETYWENSKHFILCDACYGHYIKAKPSGV